MKEIGNIEAVSKINKEAESFNITFNTVDDDRVKYEIVEIPKVIKRTNTMCKIKELRKNKQIKTLYSFDHLPSNYKFNLKISNNNENDKSIIGRKYNVIMKLHEGIELCYDGIEIKENTEVYNRNDKKNGMLYFWSGVVVSIVCVGIAINIFF